MKSWEVFWLLTFLAVFIACSNDDRPAKTELTETTSIQIDSSSFEVFHPDVLVADSLVVFNDLEGAVAIYNSILATNISDPYLKQYVFGQQIIADFSLTKSDSLFELRIEEYWKRSEQLSKPVTCLRLQGSYINGLKYYRAGDHNSIERNLNYVNTIPKGNYPRQFLNLQYANFTQLARSYSFLSSDDYRARDYFLEQERMLESGVLVSPRQEGLLYYYLSNSSLFLDDYEPGLEYALKSQDVFKSSGLNRLYIFALAAAQNCYPHLEKFKEGDVAFQTFQKSLSNSNLSKTNKFTLLTNYAGVLMEQEEASRFKIALNAAKKYIPTDTLSLSRFLERQSWLRELEFDFPEAEFLLKEAINIYDDYSEKESSQLAHFYNNLGLLYDKMNQLDSAIFYANKSIQTEYGNDFDFFQDNKFGHSSYSPDELFGKFQNLALFLQQVSFPKESADINIALAEKYYDQIFKRLNLFDKKSDHSVLSDLGELKSLINEAILCKYKLSRNQFEDLSEIYKMMEKGNAILLQKSVYKRALADKFGLPDSLFQELLDIEAELEEINYLEVEQRNSDTNDYVELLKSQDKIRFRLEEYFPGFLEALKEPKQSSLTELMKKLKSEEGVLEYSSTKLGTFVMGITAQKVRMRFIPPSDSLNVKIEELLAIINNKPTTDIFLLSQKFANLSFSIDSLLIGDIFQNEKIEILNIVPDGEIARVPFESLITQKPTENSTFYDLEYRIKSNTINYGFSSSLLFGEKEIVLDNPNIQLFAFTDQLELEHMKKEDLVRELPSSGEEIDLIAQIFNDRSVTKWKGKYCTKFSFENILPQADIIHLSVHGQADVENRYGNRLIFKSSTNESKKENYYGFELKGTNLNSKFAFLATCESGKGKTFEGEGVYSLGRNFTAAGIPSIVMGLWNLNDKVAQQMVESFYKNLNKGAKPAQALKSSKLSFLEKADDRLAHPYYWAPFISIGENNRLFN